MTGVCAEAGGQLLRVSATMKYFHFHASHLSAIISRMNELVEIKVRPDEAEFLSDPGRCDVCGHLERLHNEHCCSFCTVTGCKCYFREINEGYEA
jgi:hypothetical protein